MKPFKPRKRKPQVIPVFKTKRSVRIDERTVILVDASMTDEDARNRFMMRYRSGNKPPETYIPPVIKQEIAKVECGGSLEQMEAFVDEVKMSEVE